MTKQNTRLLGLVLPFLALLHFSADLLSCCRRLSSPRPSFTSGFSETNGWIQTKFYIKLPIRHISRPFCCLCPKFSLFAIFFFFFSFSLTGTIWELKVQIATSPTVSVRFQSNLMINMLVMGNTGSYLFGDLPNLKKNSWHFDFLLVLEVSKRYSHYSFHLISAKLHEDIGYHRWIQAITFLGDRINLKQEVQGAFTLYLLTCQIKEYW